MFFLYGRLLFSEEEIDGEAFMLMSVKDIVSMVSSKGAQLKLTEKKRQLSELYLAEANKPTNIQKVSNYSYISYSAKWVTFG